MVLPQETRPGTRGVGPVAAVGFFDGLHLGHQRLLAAARDVAAHRPLVAVVLDDLDERRRLTPIEERCRRALEHGATAVFALPVRQSDPYESCRQLIEAVSARLRPSMVVVGCAAPLQETTFPSLAMAFAGAGLRVVEISRLLDHERREVATDRIRDALERGDIDTTAALLGRPFSIVGPVVHGRELGRTIGFPTANLVPPETFVLPACGVYAGTMTRRDGIVHPAAINVGVRPTVETKGSVLVEAHVMDFSDDLYGERVTVSFGSRLRPERCFSSIEELSTQLGHDVELAREWWEDSGSDFQ